MLNLTAYSPPKINIPSVYALGIVFHDSKNDSITYERVRLFDFKLESIANFYFGLVPNLKHEIVLNHIVYSIGYARSTAIVVPSKLFWRVALLKLYHYSILASNISYPFPVLNLRVHEEFHKIIVDWTDPHYLYDPIEFLVSCNGSRHSQIKVRRNTQYICEQMMFNETNTISVETRIAIDGYTHDRIVIAKINGID